MNKLNHLVKTMRTNKRYYFKPESIFINVWMSVLFLLAQMELELKKVILIMAGRIIWQRKTLFGTMSLKIVGKETKEKS